MKTFALTKTDYLEQYLSESPYDYEPFEDCFIIKLRDDAQFFWLGFGYRGYCDKMENEKAITTNS